MVSGPNKTQQPKTADEFLGETQELYMALCEVLNEFSEKCDTKTVQVIGVLELLKYESVSST